MKKIWLFLSLGFLLGVKDPKADELRTTIFKPDLGARACKIFSRGIKSDYKDQGKDVLAVVDKLLSALKNEKATDITQLFHKRINIETSAIQATFKKINLVSPGSHEYSVYRIWAINTADGKPDLVPCKEDGLALQPHYGYDLQFGVWIQVLGSKELSRIYTSIVPVNGEWKLGSWHMQQWTHLERDPEAWVSEALDDAANGDKISAYVKLEIAAKLIDGGAFIYPKLKDDINTTMASYYLRYSDWLTAIRNILPKFNVVYVGSVFARDGAGLLVRMKVPKDSKGDVLRKDCFEIGNLIYNHGKNSGLGGIRCSYVVEKESPEGEGVLGGRFLSRKEITGKG